MNPAFILLILAGAVLIWLLLSFAFYPIGKFISSCWNRTKDDMNKDNKKGKENKK